MNDNIAMTNLSYAFRRVFRIATTSVAGLALLVLPARAATTVFSAINVNPGPSTISGTLSLSANTTLSGTSRLTGTLSLIGGTLSLSSGTITGSAGIIPVSLVSGAGSGSVTGMTLTLGGALTGALTGSTSVPALTLTLSTFPAASISGTITNGQIITPTISVGGTTITLGTGATTLGSLSLSSLTISGLSTAGIVINNASGALSTTTSIPSSSVSGVATLAGDNTFTGSNSFTGSLSANSLTLVTASLSQEQVQTQTMSNNAWNTLAEVTGASGGVVDRIWLAFLSVGGDDPRNYKIRITYDGAGTPQVFGTGGASMSSVFGPGFSNTSTYRNDRIGVTRNSSTEFAAFIKLPMPFNTGYKVEVFNTSTTGYAKMWGQVSSATGFASWPLHPSYRLTATVSTATVASLAETTGIDSVADTVLAGWFHLLDGAGSDFFYLEGDYRFYYNGSGTAGYRSSGTEDIYLSSYYFSEGLFAFRNEGLLVFDSTNYRTTNYLFYDPLTAPRGRTQFKATWTNGDAFLPPGYNTASIWTLLYYTK